MAELERMTTTLPIVGEADRLLRTADDTLAQLHASNLRAIRSDLNAAAGPLAIEHFLQMDLTELEVSHDQRGTKELLSVVYETLELAKTATEHDHEPAGDRPGLHLVTVAVPEDLHTTLGDIDEQDDAMDETREPVEASEQALGRSSLFERELTAASKDASLQYPNQVLRIEQQLSQEEFEGSQGLKGIIELQPASMLRQILDLPMAGAPNTAGRPPSPSDNVLMSALAAAGARTAEASVSNSMQTLSLSKLFLPQQDLPSAVNSTQHFPWPLSAVYEEEPRCRLVPVQTAASVEMEMQVRMYSYPAKWIVDIAPNEYVSYVDSINRFMRTWCGYTLLKSDTVTFPTPIVLSSATENTTENTIYMNCTSQ